MINELNRQEIEFCDTILLYLLDIKQWDFAYITYFDREQNIINFILFKEEITFIQVIIQTKGYNKKESLKALQKTINRQKAMKSYKKQISYITQFHLILFENNKKYIRKDSCIINDKNLLPVPCKIVFINLYLLMKKSNLTNELDSLVRLSACFEKHLS